MRKFFNRILSVVMIISMCFTMLTLNAFAEGNGEEHVHEYLESVVPPTCTQDGYTVHICACGESYTDSIIPASGHAETNVDAVSPSCTSDGHSSGTKCSICDEVLTGCDIIPSLSHEWDSGMVVSYPENGADGVIRYTCINCGQTLDEAIPYTVTYPWSDLNDEEFLSFVTCGTNDDYITGLEDIPESEEYAAFYERVSASPYCGEITEYIDSLLSPPVPMLMGATPVNTNSTLTFDSSCNSLQLSVLYPDTITCGAPTTFTMTASGGTGTYKYRLFSLTDESGNMIVDISRVPESAYSENNTYSFTFMASGTYYIRFSAMDMGSNNTINTPYYGIKIVIDDPAYPSVSAKVNTIANQCLASCSTDYDKALWLHDYIINNMTYDSSYTYCSAEGALARGTGTCEAYHRAYELLLEAVGMQHGRIEGNGHVWTAVNMDGEWYQVDTTWDDVPDTYGYDSHLNFGLNDEIMALVHSDHSPNAGYESNTLEDNWIYKSGTVSRWTNEFSQSIKDNISAKNKTFEIEISGSIPANYRNVVYNVTAYAFNKESWGSTVKSFKASYSDYGTNIYGSSVNAGKFVFTVEYSEIASGTCGSGITWSLSSDGALTITGTGEIASGADSPWKDYSDKIKEVSIPDGITSIGANSFASCTSLVSVTIPSSVSSIGSNAFSGCTSLKTVTFKGDAPAISSDSFSSVTATAVYPGSKSTWDSSKLKSYGGSLTWKDADSVTVYIESASIGAGSTIYVDGTAQTVGDGNIITLPAGSNPKVITTYSYYVPSSDIHTQYPSGMEVYLVSSDSEGNLIASQSTSLSNCLQYKGTSIRITGVKGIRVITGIPTALKSALTSSGVDGYILEEYGTMLAWKSGISDSSPLVFGTSGVLHNYAYKKGVSDPVFKTAGGLTQFTNVVTFGNDMSKCVNDLAVRPYMILSKGGDRITVYGGILYRNIGYVANQNKNAFGSGTDAYNYIWNIINYVYPDGYHA